MTAQATASPEDRQWIRRELEAAQTPEAVMERASHVLAAVSRGLGIFISPPLASSVVEHVRFLLVPDRRVLVVLVTTGGLTRDKLIRPERVFRQEDLDRIATHLNRHYVGWTLEAMRADLRLQVERDREQYGRIAGDALMLCDPAVLGDSTERKVYVEGAAQMASAVEFTSQEQLRELLEAIDEKDRLIALLSGCIEAPEPVHVELGLDKMSNAGKHLALVSASYSIERPGAGSARNSGSHAHALRARDYRRGFHGAVFLGKLRRDEDSLSDHKHKGRDRNLFLAKKFRRRNAPLSRTPDLRPTTSRNSSPKGRS